MAEHDGTVQVKMKGVMSKVENGDRLEVMFMLSDMSAGGMLSLPLRKYDETQRKYVDDAETRQHAEDLCKEKFGLSVAELSANPVAIGDMEFDGYFNGERGSLSPMQSYIRWDPIDAAATKAIDTFRDYPVESLDISEFTNVRFNVGVEIDVYGERKKLRISRFKVISDQPDVADKFVSLKYTNRQIDSLHEELQNESLDEGTRGKLQTIKDGMTAQARAARVQEMKDICGVDIEEMIEKKQHLVFNRLDIANVGDTYYIVAVIDVEETERRRNVV